MNNLYSQMHPQPDTRNLNLIQKYNSFRQDPLMFMLQNRGINVPEQYRNDPQGAIQYLMNNGQINQDQLNYVVSVAQRMGIQV